MRQSVSSESLWPPMASEDGYVMVETMLVQPQEYSVEFSSNGVTAPIRELKFVSDVSGRVVKVYVDHGTRVACGTTLLEIDKELLQADCDAALSAYESLKKNVERFYASRQAGGVSDQQLESLQSQMTAAKSRYEISRRRLADATVKAPMGGVINMRYVEPGSLIAPNAPLFDIVDDSSFKLVCNLPEGKVGHVRKGQVVELSKSGSAQESFSGKVSFIGVKSDRGMNYPVEIMVDGRNNLMAGMYLKASFKSDISNGILVPRSAIVGGLRSSMVYVCIGGQAFERNVVLGEMVGEKVEVLSGLTEGESIIVSGIMNISDGTAVKSVN